MKPAADVKTPADEKPVTNEKPAADEKPVTNEKPVTYVKPAVEEDQASGEKPAADRKPAADVSISKYGGAAEEPLQAGTGLKFRVDSIGDAEKTAIEKTDFEGEIQPTIILLEEPVSLTEPSQESAGPKKRGRRKKQESVQEQPKTEDEPGDAIQMELPL